MHMVPACPQTLSCHDIFEFEGGFDIVYRPRFPPRSADELCGRCTEAEAACIIKGVASALRDCHKAAITHRCALLWLHAPFCSQARKACVGGVVAQTVLASK